MRHSIFVKNRLGCAYFFFCPGLAYGLLTSRFPALQEQTGANEAEIGLILLCLGAASLLTLLCSGAFIGALGNKRALQVGVSVMAFAEMACGLVNSPLQLALGCMGVGLGMGLLDVAMNMQGIQFEKRYRLPTMAFMHAFYSIGGLAGAIGGSIFAALHLNVFINVASIIGFYICFLPIASHFLLRDAPAASCGKQKIRQSAIPLFVVICGLMSMCAYSAEGAVAEWGSLFLFTNKGAPASQAALVFAVFSIPVVACRLVLDHFRLRYGDFTFIFWGALVAACGMFIVLMGENAVICLCGYGIMGAGLSPITPILFSSADRYKGINPARASAIVALFSYCGLLLFPPMLGFVGQHAGLQKAMLVVIGVCVIIAAGAIALKLRQYK